jgi:hypothetical protein
MLRRAASYPARRRNQRYWQEISKKEFKELQEFKKAD